MINDLPFFNLFLPRPNRSRRAKRRRPRDRHGDSALRTGRRLALEQLEERTLLSVTVTDQEALVVTITGNEAVTIGCTGSTAFSLLKVNSIPYTTLCSAVSSISVVAQGTFDNNINLNAVAAPFIGLNGMVTVNGGDGNDVITGSAFDDLLVGGAGNDSIVGGSGNDSCFGGDGTDTIAGGTGNDFLDGGAGLNSIVGDAGGDTLALNNGSQSGAFRLQMSSGKLVLSVNSSQVFNGDPSTIETVAVVGAAGNDSLVIDNSGGTYSGTISFDGVSGNDSLEVIQGQTGSYQPSGTDQGSGSLVVYDSGITQNIQFQNLTPVTVHGFSGFTLTTPNSGDVLTISSPAAGKNKISGTSGNVGFESLTFFDITTFTIQAGAKDLPGSGQDSITVDSSGLKATGLQNFVVNTGLDDDTFAINSADDRLPVAGGTIAFNAGGGANTFAATADVSFVLTDSVISLNVGEATFGAVALASVQTANIKGGAGDNVFDVTHWTNVAMLDGGGGAHDSVVAVNDSDFVLSDNSLTRSTGGTFLLTSVEMADLTGGEGPNSFTVSNWTGSATLRGRGGSDLYTINLTTSDSGSTTIVDEGSTGTDCVTVNGTPADDPLIETATAVTRGHQTVSFNVVEKLTINSLAGNDTISVRAADVPTTVNAGTGDDTFNAGSLEPDAGGVLDAINAPIVLNGDAGTNSFNADDSGDTKDNTGTLTPNSLTGLGLGGGISYNPVAFVNVTLGSGNDSLTVTNTIAGSNTVGGGAGADVITFENISGPTTVNGNAGADTINIRSTNAATTVNGGAGDDTVNLGTLAPAAGGTVNSITGPLVISGGDDSDTLNLDDTADTAANTLLVTPSTISGIGMAGGITYDTLEAMNISLGSGSDTINVRGTATGTATRVHGGAGEDAFSVSSDAPQHAGNLDAVNGALTIDGGPGSNTLVVSDKTDTTGNGDVIIGTTTIANFAGAGDDVPINYAATGGTFSGITVNGSDSATLSEVFQLSSPNGPLTLNANSGADAINVRSLIATATVDAGLGSDLINVGSLAPAAGGDLNQIGALLTVHGNDGSELLIVDDSGDSTANTGTLTDHSITGLGMTGGINYDTIEELNISLGSGGDNFTIESTHTGTTTVSAGGGDDVVNVQTTNGAATVNGGSGHDTVNVGSLMPAAGGTVNSIRDDLTVNGDGDSDTLNLDDTGDSAPNSGVLTSNTITGLGLATRINYATLEAVNLSLGSGGNIFTIASTHAGSTTLNSGDSATNPDTVNVQTTDGPTTVNGQAGADTVNVGSLAPATGGTVDEIDGALEVNGDGGSDTLNVDDIGDATPNTGTLATDSLIGLGMDHGITYSTIESLNISLGSGGNTFNIVGTHAGSTTLNSGDSAANPDTVNVRAIGGPTTVNAQAGDDTVNVGSLAPDTGGDLNSIAAPLTIHGNDGSDALNVDDTGDATPNTGTLTATTITGLGMTGGINYDTIEELDIALGSGGDTFTIASTYSGPTTVSSGSGDDVVNVQTLSGPTTLNGGEGDDRINIGSLAPATGGTVNSIAAPLTVNGDGGSDTMNVDDTGDTTPNTGTLTTNTVAGLGIASPIHYETLEAVNIALGTGGNTFTIASTHAGSTTLSSGDSATHPDTINVQTTAGPTSVDAQAGADTINLGSLAPAADGTIAGIDGALAVYGGSGFDVLNVDDTGNSAGATGTLTGTSLTGFDMDHGLTYGTVEALNVSLGSGGDTLTIAGTHTGTTVVAANDGADTINVQAVSGATTVHGGSGDDTVNVGSLAPDSGGTVNAISAPLTVNGDGGSDTMNVDDTGDTTPNSGTLSATTITGLGMSAGITYGTLETLNIALGSGGNTFTIGSTHAGTTTVSSGGGGDVVNVRTVSGPTTVNGGGGADTINVGTLAPATGGAVNSISAPLSVNGDGGSDTMNVDDTGDAAPHSGTLTAMTIIGLGTSDGITYGTLESLNIALGTGGNTFTIASTHAGSTTLSSGDSAANPDTVNVQSTAGATSVNAQAGDDTINLGSLAPATGGTIAGIDGVLAVNGGVGSDVLNVDDTGNSTGATGTLTATSLTGFGMDQGTTYGAVEALNLSFGSGGDTLTIAGTHAGTTVVNMNDGPDQVTVQSSSVPTTVNGGAGDDVLTGSAGNDLLFGGPGNDVLADGLGDDQLDGGPGDDTYVLTPGSADVITDPDGSDTVDFSKAKLAIRIDLDLSEPQRLDTAGNTLQLAGQIENFVGSRFNDVIFADPLDVPRDINGGPQTAVPPGDTLNYDHNHGAVAVTPTTLAVAGFATSTYADIETLITTGFTRHFDFNQKFTDTSSSPTAPGYLPVSQSDLYDPKVGFGWKIGAAPIAGFDRCASSITICISDPLLRDGDSGRFATLLIDTTPEQGYSVNVVMGDLNYSHDHVSVRVGGVPVLSDLTNPVGQFLNRTFLVSPNQLSAGGQLALDFSDDGGVDQYFAINALDIRAAIDVSTVTMTLDPAGLVNDGVSQTVITGNTFPPLAEGALVTVFSSLGKILSADKSPVYAGVQVATDSDGRFQFVLQAPTIVGTASIRAEEVTGAAVGTASLPVSFAFTRQFDFNTPGSPTGPGQIGVPLALYSPGAGFGWQSLAGLNSTDRFGPNSVDRDFHAGRGGIFLIDTPSVPTPYTVTLRMGDKSFKHDNIDVFAEGSLAVHIDSIAAGSFQDFMFQTVVSDGQLTLEFRDSGGTDPNFVINGLTLVDPPAGSVKLVGNERANVFTVSKVGGVIRGTVDGVVKAQITAAQAAKIGGLQLFGLAGDDVFQIDPSVDLPVMIDPGAGTDAVNSGGSTRIDLVGPTESLHLAGPFSGYVQSRTSLGRVEISGDMAGELRVAGAISSLSVSGGLSGRVVASAIGARQIVGAVTGTLDVGLPATMRAIVPTTNLDTIGPRVESWRLVSTSSTITDIVLSFDEDLQPSTVRNLSNYSLSGPGKDGLFGTRDDLAIPLSSAVYDATSRAVRLTPKAPLAQDQFYRVSVSGSGEIKDIVGNQLDGDGDRKPGGNYVLTLGRGTKLSYVDHDGDAVALALTNGGIMELILDGNGDGQELRLINTVPKKSILSATVRSVRPKSSGDTVLSSVSVLQAGSTKPQTLPRLVLGRTFAAAVDVLLASGQLV